MGEVHNLVLYVADILLVANDLSIMHETKDFLSNQFEMKDMKEASYVIGIDIVVIDHSDC